ncbi:hypothetical protein NHQ30_001588 [Ciborinia camelliae]|nr:hypothetical protein NHQ30_001588 [Ciborinia camelliae]
MLLTSGQVSVAISSFIESHPRFMIISKIDKSHPVFFFTTALFLSGYVLQQQTVRDLREAIKPQFQAKLVGLEVSDNLNMNADRSGRKSQVEVFLPKKFEIDGVREDDVRMEIKGDMEVGEEGASGRRKKGKKTRGRGNREWSDIEERVLKTQKESGGRGEDGDRTMDDVESIGREEGEITVPGKSLSRAERRRKIKEDLVTSGEGETFTGYRRRLPGA